MIYLASDHAGFELKKKLKEFLGEEGYEFEDVGPFTFDKLDDYPDFIIPAAEKVAKHPDNKGIILGGTGQGEAIAANKVKGIRAAVFYGSRKEIVELSREHNNANILSLGARFLTDNEAKESVKTWLEASYSNDKRHSRRISKISNYEQKGTLQ
jgi:ribose 5-phosphate isomerase B